MPGAGQTPPQASVITEESYFPTFCHISEFGERAYRRLTAMAAVSRPLTLWSPSLQEAGSWPSGQLDAKVLVNLVANPTEPGRTGIRIAGREDWIYNGPRRRSRAEKWPGAAWTPWDAQIRDIAECDKNEDDNRKRVLVVGEADGYDRADEFLDSRPNVGDAIGVFIARGGKIPEGTRERIVEQNLVGWRAAREVLRDARNHGRAIKDTASKVPFLTLEYARFIDLMNQLDDPIEVIPTVKQIRSTKAVIEATLDLLDELQKLGRPDIAKLLSSKAHAKMAKWMNGMVEYSDGKNVSDIDRFVLDEFSRAIERESPSRSPLETLEDFHVYGSILFEAVRLALHPWEALEYFGMGFAVKEHGRSLLARLGVASPYNEMLWVFLYVFGHPPNAQEAETVRYYLELRAKRQARDQV